MLRLILVSLAIASVALAQPAPKADKAQTQACFDAYEATQGARRDGRLIEARDAAIICSADACPRTLSRDCVKWVGELQAIIPGLVFDVRLADGSNVTDVTVTMDGKALLTKVDGKAVPVDPGEHVLQFLYADYLPVETRVVALEGDKARKVQVSFKKPEAPKPEETRPVFKMGRPIPVTTWIFAGTGAALLAASGIVGLVGLSGRGQLERCKPNCLPTEVVPVARALAWADGLLISGLVAGAAAAVIFFTRPEVPIGIAVVPTSSGGVLSVSGAF
jgi:hypothetical protein